METNILDKFRDDPEVQVAEQILRKCVHCGFCLATCPTYNLLGDELDSPRGRIYQIKQVLEGVEPDAGTQLHLDRCLTCRNCETTCPSGVEYGRLLDIGRHIVEQSVPRSFGQRVMRFMLKTVLPYPNRIGPLVKLGQFFRPVLPQSIAASIPPRQPVPEVNAVDSMAGQSAGLISDRQPVMLMLDGCVQPSMSPATNAAAIRVLARLGITVVQGKSVCCGAIDHHLNDAEQALDKVRRNIDSWWPYIEEGAEAVLVTASGCGSMLKDYGHLLAHDTQYQEKAQRVAALSRDIGEVLLDIGVEAIRARATNGQLNTDAVRELVNARRQLIDRDASSLAGESPAKVAFHPPCSLQHGQKMAGQIEKLLTALDFDLVTFEDARECCGSAGTYSIFQPRLSAALKARKMANIHRAKPDVIATANIGCQLHLQSVSDIPVIHWIELLDAALPVSMNNATFS